MSRFFDMGGYALYVWPSYAITLGAVVLNVIWARRSLAHARAAAQRRLMSTGSGP